MLHRMFLRSNSASAQTTQPVAPLPSSAQSYEDTLTRMLLYGTPDLLPSTIRITERSKQFRLVVFQDGGIRSKHALFDSAVVTAAPQQSCHPTQTSQQAPSQPQKLAKLDGSRFHSQRELMTHMFGHGVLVETTNSVKIHVLPPLPNMPESILLTRLVSLELNFTSVVDSGSHTQDWNPQATIRSCQRDCPVSNGSTRFGIGVVVPISTKDFDEVIADNWEEVADELAALQNLLLNKLQTSATRSKSVVTTSSSPTGKLSLSLKFAPFSLQHDQDLQNGLLSFIRMTIFLLETPRLLIGLTNREDTALIDWAQTVASWLEFKDGRLQHLKFLAALFDVLIPIRKQLLHKPCERSRPTYRVVIMTGNPMVSQKLIFILTGLFIDDDDIVFIDGDQPEEASQQSTENSLSAQTTITKDPLVSRPIPITQNPREDVAESLPKYLRLLEKPTLTSGWEIPSKTSPSESPLFTKNFESATNFDNAVARPTQTINRQSSYASLQGLSTSLSTQSSLAQMSQSWMNHGFSILDKWRNNDKQQPPSLSSSFKNYRTPSPAMEYEEYPWLSSSGSNSQSPRVSKPSSSIDVNRVPKMPQIRRGPSLVGSVTGESSLSSSVSSHYVEHEVVVGKRYNEIKHKCRSIMTLDPITSSSDCVLEASFPEKLKPLPQRKVLLPLCGYLEQFCPEFSLESCPISTHLENSIMEVMKDDVNRMDLTQGCFKQGHTITKTILVSLRAREINEYEIKMDDSYHEEETQSHASPSQISNLTTILQNHSLSSSLSSSPLQHSPASSMGSFSSSSRPPLSGRNSYNNKEAIKFHLMDVRPTVRKLFSPNRKYQYLDRFHVSRVDELLNRIADISRKANDDNRHDIAKRIRMLVDELLAS